MPRVSPKPPQMIPIGQSHRLLLDHARRTARVEFTTRVSELFNLRPGQILEAEVEAETQLRTWAARGYAIER